jgi:hypothetical protein
LGVFSLWGANCDHVAKFGGDYYQYGKSPRSTVTAGAEKSVRSERKRRKPT